MFLYSKSAFESLIITLFLYNIDLVNRHAKGYALGYTTNLVFTHEI